MSKHELPTLPYSLGALEPHVDTQTMTLHFGQHHTDDVAELNRALEKYPALLEMSVEALIAHLDSIPEDIREVVRYRGGSHANHSQLWSLLKRDSADRPVRELAKAISRSFGTFENFKVEFEVMSLGHVGAGWAWLSLGPLGNLIAHSMPYQDNPLMVGRFPVLGIDLREHAYYLKHQNRRLEYLSEFWQVLDWERAELNFERALSSLEGTVPEGETFSFPM